MKRSKFFIVKLPIYNAEIGVSIGQNVGDLKKSILRRWNIDEENLPKEDFQEHQQASVLCVTKGEHYYPYCIRFKQNPIKMDIDGHATIAHEVFHTVYRLLNSRGLKLTYESEEAFTYLMGHLSREIYKNLR